MSKISQFKVTINNKPVTFLAKIVDEKEGIYELVKSTGETWHHTLTTKNENNPVELIHSSWSEFTIENKMMVAHVRELKVIQRHVIGEIIEITPFKSSNN